MSRETSVFETLVSLFYQQRALRGGEERDERQQQREARNRLGKPQGLLHHAAVGREHDVEHQDDAQQDEALGHKAGLSAPRCKGRFGFFMEQPLSLIHI